MLYCSETRRRSAARMEAGRTKCVSTPGCVARSSGQILGCFHLGTAQTGRINQDRGPLDGRSILIGQSTFSRRCRERLRQCLGRFEHLATDAEDGGVRAQFLGSRDTVSVRGENLYRACARSGHTARPVSPTPTFCRRREGRPMPPPARERRATPSSESTLTSLASSARKAPAGMGEAACPRCHKRVRCPIRRRSAW